MYTLIDLRRLMLVLCERLAFLPPLLVRLVLGTVFVHSGWGKLHHLDQVIRFFESLGVPAPELQAPFVACVELGCGLLVLVGFATRFAAVPLMATMVVALSTALASKIHGANSLFGQSEFLYIVLLFGLAIGGAGALSLDRVVARELERVDAEDRAEAGAAPLGHAQGA